MALWQIHFSVVPAASIVEEQGVRRLSVSEEERLEPATWPHDILDNSFLESLDHVLPRHKNWGPSLFAWGVDDGDKVSLSIYDDGIEWYWRYDLRTPNFGVLETVTRITSKLNGVFVASTNYIVQPTVPTVAKHIQASSAFRFVADPQRFFDEYGL